MQSKKSQYEIYTLMMEGEIKEARKAFGQHFPKGLSNQDVLSHIFGRFPELTRGLNYQIFSEEYFWKRSGGNTVFPESTDVLDNLMRARFQMEVSGGFTLPFQSFMLALPNGYKVDGLKIPSFLVTWIPYKETAQTTIEPFTKYVKIKGSPVVNLEPDDRGSHSIALCYRDPETPTAYARTLIGDEQIPELLSTSSTQEFGDLIGSYRDIKDVHSLSDHDLKLQQTMLKLVAAFGIYNMATDGERLQPGFPGNQAPKLIGKPTDSPMRYTTLKNAFPKPAEGSSVSKESFYRTWHFRQLRAERYYQGDFQNYTVGSRYVFVSDTVVGSKVTAHTQK